MVHDPTPFSRVKAGMKQEYGHLMAFVVLIFILTA